MKQQVVIYQAPDRHAVPHERDFGTTREYEVPAGSLVEVLQEAVSPQLLEGKYVIVVGWPHE